MEQSGATLAWAHFRAAHVERFGESEAETAFTPECAKLVAYVEDHDLV